MESGTQPAKYNSNSSSSMSEKFVQTDKAGEAMAAAVVLFAYGFIVGRVVDGSRSLEFGGVEGAFQEDGKAPSSE